MADFLPEFNFVIDPEKITSWICTFLNPKNLMYEEFSKEIFKDHPYLEQITGNNLLKKKNQEINKYIYNFYSKHKEEICNYKEKLAIDWLEKWPKISRILSKQLDCNWKKINSINCYVGIVHIYPRYLNLREFQVCYLDHQEWSKAVILHELTHFLYFKKWQELFPQDKLSTFEAPSPIWHLSEIMAPILNDEVNLKKLVPAAAIKSYPIYNQVFSKSINKSIFNYFKNQYLVYKKNGKNIEEFLTKARTEITKIKI